MGGGEWTGNSAQRGGDPQGWIKLQGLEIRQHLYGDNEGGQKGGGESVELRDLRPSWRNSRLKSEVKDCGLSSLSHEVR